MAKITKRCFKCEEEKPLSGFYPHPQMRDGHLNKCKECAKFDARGARSAKVEYYRDYDRRRGNRQERGYSVAYNKQFPGKARAHRLVNYHLRKGNLLRKPCEECGVSENIHAHHDDYAAPLNVRWLCAVCHKAWHIIHGEAPNGI